MASSAMMTETNPLAINTVVHSPNDKLGVLTIEQIYATSMAPDGYERAFVKLTASATKLTEPFSIIELVSTDRGYAVDGWAVTYSWQTLEMARAAFRQWYLRVE